MNALTHWNPVREMMSLRREFDRLFENALGLPQFGETVTSWGLALDIVENDDAFIVKASVPGIDPNDLDITLADNTLTIRGEFKEDEKIDKEQYRLRERRFGSFARSVTLSATVDRDAIEAMYENGVLTLRIPKAEEVKPKRISVKTQVGRKKTIVG
ncbi:MAG: Hsp20/alpha crystallin family protein [Anaerolineae bacterium]